MQQGKQQPQHQPADGPAFWNITLDFKPGELESDLTKMFFNQALDLHKENEALKQHVKRLEDRIDLLMSANADVARIAGERDKAEKRVLYLESALREIANQDYRGSRSTESQIAFRALQP
jgi:hypothetical protein